MSFLNCPDIYVGDDIKPTTWALAKLQMNVAKAIFIFINYPATRKLSGRGNSIINSANESCEAFITFI